MIIAFNLLRNRHISFLMNKKMSHLYKYEKGSRLILGTSIFHQQRLSSVAQKIFNFLLIFQFQMKNMGI